MTGQGASKGNGASKRMMNPKLKDKRSASWARGQKRKELRRKANEARAMANLAALHWPAPSGNWVNLDD